MDSESATKQPIPFEELVREAEKLFAEAESGKQIVVDYHGKPYRISPMRHRSNARRRRRLTPIDPIFDIMGMGDSGGPGDVSLRVDDYLAQAYTAEFGTSTPDDGPTHKSSPDSSSPNHE